MSVSKTICSFFAGALFLIGCGYVQESPVKKQAAAKKSENCDDCTAAPGCEFCGTGLDRASFVLAQVKNGKTFRDWPMFGGSPDRNMVNLVEKNPPTDWKVEGEKKNVKWMALLGSNANGGPVIADGKVYVATNNARPRDPKDKEPKAVLMCFRESDGVFLWQATHTIPNTESFRDARVQGLCSTPTVVGDRIYYVTPTCELICTDTKNGKMVWEYDMMEDLKVIPYHLGNCSPLVYGDHVFVVTSNGVNDEGKIPSPEAPSFIAVNKNTGKLKWQSNLPGSAVIEGQWSNPALAMVDGKLQVIFPGGDAWIYSFEPESGKLIWKFNCHPGRPRERDPDAFEIPNYIVSTPVVHGDKCYVGLGLYPEHGQPTPFSRLICIDVTKTGDVSPKNFDPKSPENKGSALVWQYGGKIEPRPKTGRSVYFGRTISTCAIHDGLVYIPEENGYMHCVDAKTGKRYWMHDLLTAVWGSPMWIDGKVYLGTEDYQVVIYAHGKELKVIAKVDMDDVIHSTPVMANGVMYITTRSKLYAIEQKK